MKKNSLILLAILMSCTLLVFSCTELLYVKNSSLVVTLPTGRFITNPEGVNISKYTVGIQNKEGKTETKTGVPGQSLVFENISLGEYLVYAEAYDEEKKCVAYAKQKTEVKAGKDTSVVLKLIWNLLTYDLVESGEVIFEVTPPNKTTYVHGEVFDPTGLKVEAVFKNGYRQEIPAVKYDATGATSQSIYYEIQSDTLQQDEDGNYIITSVDDTSADIRITWGTNTEDYNDDGEYEIETAFTLTIEHTFAEAWTADENGHWHACTCGEKSGFEEHTYGTWNVVQAPKITQEGKNERICSGCGYTDSVVLQPAPDGFVYVEGGTVTGATNENNYEGVFIEGRTVTLSDFYMGKYEVTQEEYASVMAGQKVTVDGTEYTLESNPSYCIEGSAVYTKINDDVQEKRPVEGVTWYDAVWYCNALSEKEGLTKAYNIEVTTVNISNHITAANVTLNENANGYRLPTEAEWEYAARSGDPTAEDWNYVFSGADTAKGVSYKSSTNLGLDSVGWYSYNSEKGTTGVTTLSIGSQGYGTHQVGKKAANKLGLYDMSGNVYEWCWDWYGAVNTGNESDPTGADTSSGSGRVYRGGSWDDLAYYASVCYRRSYTLYGRSYFLGFRVVRSAK